MDARERLEQANAIRRLIDRDPTLFSSDVDQRQPIMQRLGWTDLATKASGRLPLVKNLARALIDEGATDIVLLGMGGSSLAPLVISRIIGAAPGSPELHVLDTTCPSTIATLKERLRRSSTYFLISSKSGTTIEPLSLYAIFREWMEEELERVDAGRHFIAITDPGTPLDKMKQKDVMRVAISAPPTVGGRFSALTVFGLTPAAMIGVDLDRFVELAADMEHACHGRAEEPNPGVELAAWLADGSEAGRDKVTLVTSSRYGSFGLWVEQLIAESTGKHGTGLVPVVEYLPTTPTGYGADRAVAVLRESSDSRLASFAATTREEGHPVIEFVLDDPLGIGAEFVRWEFAVALTGHLLGINPFDEPNVSEAKKATNEVLAGTASVPPAIADIGGIWPTYAGAYEGATAPVDLKTALSPLLATVNPGDYFVLLAYLPEEDAYFEPLRSATHALASATGNAVCLELGPRYLHSTGQLHKGGPDTGVFLLITMRDRANMAVPGKPFSLATLYRSQAEGDLVTLAAAGRRVMRLDLPGNDVSAVRQLAEALVSLAR